MQAGGDSFGSNFNPGGGFNQAGQMGQIGPRLPQDQSELTEQNQKDDKKQEELKLPKKALSGFQQFVFDTTGRIFPHFGDCALQ